MKKLKRFIIVETINGDMLSINCTTRLLTYTLQLDSYKKQETPLFGCFFVGLCINLQG